MVNSEGFVLNRFYLLEVPETDALTKIIQFYAKPQGLITLYVRDIYIDSHLYGKLELFDKINIWWESAKELANLVDIIDYKRNKKIYTYENFMGFSYIAKVIREDVKLYDEYIYNLVEYFWNYEFGKNFYLEVMWFILHIMDYLGIRALFLDKDFSKSPQNISINPQDGDIGFSRYSIKVKKEVLELLKNIEKSDLDNIRSFRVNIGLAKEGVKFIMKLFKGLSR